MKFEPNRYEVRSFLVDTHDWNRDCHEMIAGTEDLLSLNDDGPVTARNLCDSRGFRRVQGTAPDYMVVSQIWEIDDKRPDMRLSYESAKQGRATVLHESAALRRWKREKLGVSV